MEDKDTIKRNIAIELINNSKSSRVYLPSSFAAKILNEDDFNVADMKKAFNFIKSNSNSVLPLRDEIKNDIEVKLSTFKG